VGEVLEEHDQARAAASGDPDGPARAPESSTRSSTKYRGVIAYIRVVDGVFRKGQPDPRDGGGHEAEHRRHRLLPARR